MKFNLKYIIYVAVVAILYTVVYSGLSILFSVFIGPNASSVMMMLIHVCLTGWWVLNTFEDHNMDTIKLAVMILFIVIGFGPIFATLYFLANYTRIEECLKVR